MARLLLQRWINRITLSLLGSANLVRPRLRPNGPSDTASRHRLQRPQRQDHASIANRSISTIRLLGEDKSSGARVRVRLSAQRMG